MPLEFSRKIIKNYWFILFLLVVFHAINNYTILSLDNTFPTYDEYYNLEESFNIFCDFKTLNLSDLYSWYSSLGAGGSRPPLYLIVVSLTNNISHNINADYSIFIANMLYFGVLLFSVFGIGRILAGVRVGLFAAVIVSLFPGVFAMSRVLMVDFPLAAMLSLSIYLMLKTEYFVNTKYSFLFGLSAGLGLLTKVSYLIFILPVLGYYSIASILKLSKNNSKFSVLGKNLAFYIFTALLVAASWYLPNLDKIIPRSKAMSFIIVDKSSGLRFIDYYLSLLFSYHLCIFFFILGLIFLFYCLKKKRGTLLSVWIFIPLVIFSFSPNKNPRFILPLLPAMGLIIAQGVFLINRARIRRIVCGFIIVFGLSLYFAISYGQLKLPFRKPNLPFYSVLRVNYGILSPLRIDWRAKEAGEMILTSLQPGNSTKRIKMLSMLNLGEIYYAIDYYLTNKNKKVLIDCPAALDDFDAPGPDNFGNITAFDFVINKSGHPGYPNSKIDWFKILKGDFERNRGSFCLVGSLQNLPDGSTLDIFKKK
jgi:4-amino-4-deoxy-L-arabinose transferase-like glycosyltransferase